MNENQFQQGQIYKLLTKYEEYVLIMSSNLLNQINPFVEIVYLKKEPYKCGILLVEINSLQTKYYAFCDQIHTIEKEKLGMLIDTLTQEEMKIISEAICFSMNLSNQSNINHLKEQNQKLEMERDTYKNFIKDLIKT